MNKAESIEHVPQARPGAADQEPSIKRTQSYLSASKVSALSKYQRLVVGSRGFLPLLKFEIITTLLIGMPGILGLVLRRVFYRQILRRVGKNVILGRNVVIRHPSRVQIGNNVIIEDQVVLDGKGEGGEGIHLHDNVFIGRGTIISARNGGVDIGEGASISSSCRITTSRIGRKVLIAAYVYIISGGHTTDRIDIPIIDQPVDFKGGVDIEDGCWIGAFTGIMDGVRIGHDSIIGAHSLVTRHIPPFGVAYGVPAAVQRYRYEENKEK